MFKICTNCKISKDISEFRIRTNRKNSTQPHCKQCEREKSKLRYINKSKNYKEQIKIYDLKNQLKECSYCRIIKPFSEFNFKNDSKTKLSSQCKNCYNNNRKPILYKTQDINFKIKSSLRSRILIALKDNIKSKHTLELLGCSIDEFKIHLQQTAISNGYKDFNINNYSGKEYHIDHIKPCVLFDLSKSEEQAICFHYSNMQILTAKENLQKSDKI